MSTIPSPSDPADGAWSRVLTSAEKLTAALDALDDVGGVRRLARRLKPRSIEKGVEALREARQAIDAQLAVLESQRRTAPGFRSPGAIPRPGGRP